MSATHHSRKPCPGRRARRLHWQYLSDGPGEVLVGAFTSSALRVPVPPVEAGDEVDDRSLVFAPTAWGLLLPTDPATPCRVRRIPRSATGISGTIGGGMLAETPCLVEQGIHTIYQDADRDARGFPANERAFRLAARLGWPHVERRISLRGSVLVLGLDGRGEDTHVPALVLDAAIREGLLPGGRAMFVLNGKRRTPMPEENAS